MTVAYRTATSREARAWAAKQGPSLKRRTSHPRPYSRSGLICNREDPGVAEFAQRQTQRSSKRSTRARVTCVTSSAPGKQGAGHLPQIPWTAGRRRDRKVDVHVLRDLQLETAQTRHSVEPEHGAVDRERRFEDRARRLALFRHWPEADGDRHLPRNTPNRHVPRHLESSIRFDTRRHARKLHRRIVRDVEEVGRLH